MSSKRTFLLADLGGLGVGGGAEGAVSRSLEQTQPPFFFSLIPTVQTLTDEPLQVGLASPRCLRRDVDAELFSNISDVMGFQPVSPVAASICVPSTLLLQPFYLFFFFGFLPLFFFFAPSCRIFAWKEVVYSATWNHSLSPTAFFYYYCYYWMIFPVPANSGPVCQLSLGHPGTRYLHGRVPQ